MDTALRRLLDKYMPKDSQARFDIYFVELMAKLAWEESRAELDRAKRYAEEEGKHGPYDIA